MVKTLSVRARRRWLLVGLGLLSCAGGTLWYVRHEQEEQELSERALKDIPKDEYESWMQSLGYTD